MERVVVRRVVVRRFLDDILGGSGQWVVGSVVEFELRETFSLVMWYDFLGWEGWWWWGCF